MNPYEEILDGERLPRCAPGQRHEAICALLHQKISACMAAVTHSRLLSPRSPVRINQATWFKPDLAVITSGVDKLWLAVEIIDRADHRHDTVTKKLIYEEINIPRLWMVDPRYDNVEVYHGGEHGLCLKHMLAGKDILSEPLLPEFSLVVADLFGTV